MQLEHTEWLDDDVLEVSCIANFPFEGLGECFGGVGFGRIDLDVDHRPPISCTATAVELDAIGALFGDLHRPFDPVIDLGPIAYDVFIGFGFEANPFSVR